MDKQQLYLTMVEQLYGMSSVDVWLMENEPGTWEQARQIDDFLVTYVNDDRVSVQQFERNVQRLLTLYLKRNTLFF